LADAGARVVIVDRGLTHRSEVEMLSAQARTWLRNLQWALDVPGREIAETVALWNGSWAVTSSALGNPYGYALSVRRATFDAAILQAARAAGVVVVSAGRAVKMEASRATRRTTVRTHGAMQAIDSSIVVLATGRGVSLVTKGMRRQRQVAALAVDETASAGVTFYLERTERGWWYVLPQPDLGRFVGFCSDPSRWEGSSLAKIWRNDLHKTRIIRHIVAPPQTKAGFTACPAAVVSRRSVVGDRWVAVGDAAFAPDPLSGQGIELALEGGSRAAGAILGPTCSGFSEYADWIATVAADHDQTLGKVMQLDHPPGAEN
jgi:flavin-dependent dehydrogenase